MTTSDSRFVLASRLAQFLRRNGDKVISGTSKLSLTTSALCLLNSLFIDVLQQNLPTNVDLSSASSIEIQEDVKYLYDFMKKTTSLKLFHGMQTLRGGVDLSHFSNLTVLELRKIPAHLIIGLNSLSFQLKALICSRSIYLLKELFGYSVDEENTSDVWTELKELNLSYNYLENLDSSLRNLPNVEILDLSHNNVRNTDEIQVLKRLYCVNLNYNQLDTLPVFSSLSCRFMSKLYIRNNHLENLDGLECLFNLEELDVGYNLLSEYSQLNPLDKLKSMKVLNLEGNPLYFHKQHFQLVCNFIHPFALNRGLHLNGKFIAIPQNMNTLVKEDEINSGRHQTSLNTVVGDMQNVIRPPEIRPQRLKDVSSLISITSDKSYTDDNCASSYTSQKSLDESIAVGTRPKKKKNKSKKKKGRVVVINEPQEESEGNKEVEFSKLDNNEIQRHLLVKEIYESRREERGESWLIPDNPFKTLENDLKVPTNTPVCRSDNAPVSDTANVLSNESNFSDKDFTVLRSHKTFSSTPIDSEMQEALNIQNGPISDADSDRRRHISKESDDIEVLASNLQGSSSSEQINALSSEDLSDGDFYKSISHCSADDSLSECEDESEDSIFCVERIDKMKNMETKTVFVKIGAKYAKEKDVITGKLLDTLDLSSLVSVRKDVSSETFEDEIKRYEVQLDFDTVKTSRQQRLYIFQDLSSAEHFCKILQPFADASTLKEATLGALECMKCKSVFSKQVANRKVLITKRPHSNKDGMPASYDSYKGYYHEADACPNCGNDILVELESIPLPSVAAPPSQKENPANIAHSSDSAGSSSSGYLFSNLLNSFKISPSTKRKSLSGAANDNAAKITTKASEAIGICQNEKLQESESQMSRNSSDVTIISNPSQSSIAVIPEPCVESNLNTIPERDSQASLSPPISRGSTICNDEKVCKNEDKHDSIVLSTRDDPDFYSMTESFTDEKEKTFKCGGDVVSNDSDLYHSPNKSTGSSNFKVVKEASETDRIMLILGEKKIATYDSFKHLDHRLKLHIEIYIFRKDEYINCCLQTSIVPLSTGEEFEGVFLLSSENIYIIKFLPQYDAALERNESLAKQVQVLYSGSLSQVKQIKLLLGNQGICVACGPPAHVYMLIIRDSDTCNSFSNLISEQILEKNSQFQCLTFAKEVLETQYESVLTCESGDKPEILLHQFAFKRDKDIVLPVCITLTKEDLYLFKIFYKKQQSCLDLSEMEPYFLSKYDCQKISDVISLKLGEHFCTVEICFLIEASDIDSLSWTIEMPTRSSMFSFVSALKTPWEDIFAVPLPLSITKNSS